MYLEKHNSELGWVQAAFAAGQQIVGSIAQNKALKTQVKGAKIGLETVREQRAAQAEAGAQMLARDKLKIIMVGIGSLAALGVGYLALNRRGR